MDEWTKRAVETTKALEEMKPGMRYLPNPNSLLLLLLLYYLSSKSLAALFEKKLASLSIKIVAQLPY